MIMANKILMHVCCAPCACYPFNVLKEEGFKVKGYWYNPNIHGFKEHRKRLMTLGYFLTRSKNFSIIEGEYEPGNWFKGVRNYSKPLRCESCYRIRLNATAQTARSNGFEIFTTTLLYSKFQEHSRIKKISEEISDKHKIKFLYKDFREGWKKGVKISKEMGLYRQQYCGCLFSEMERENVS